jgi:hypothetical protein
LGNVTVFSVKPTWIYTAFLLRFPHPLLNIIDLFSSDLLGYLTALIFFILSQLSSLFSFFLQLMASKAGSMESVQQGQELPILPVLRKSK